MLRAFTIIGILAACAFMANWFTIDRSKNETTIRFNREEIREDASKALAKGREFLNRENPAEADQGLFGQQSAQQQDGFDSLRNVITESVDQSIGITPQQATLPRQPWE